VERIPPSHPDDEKRVVRFEVERDAPAYFPDRQTVAEAAAASDEDA